MQSPEIPQERPGPSERSRGTKDILGEQFLRAIYEKNIETLIELLNFVNLDEQDSSGRTPIMHALSIKENEEIVNLILEKYPDLLILDNEGNSVLFYAVFARNPGLLKRILNELIEQIKEKWQISYEKIIENEINRRNDDTFSPIFYAVHSDDLESVILLKENGADLELEDGGGNTILLYSLENFFAEQPAWSLPGRDSNKSEQSFQGMTNENITKYLLEQGANPNHGNIDGFNALHRATTYGNSKLIDLLLKYNADINRRTEEGYTPLFLAIDSGNYETFSLLLNRGARFETEPLPEGIPSLLQLIVSSNSVEILREYLRRNPTIRLDQVKFDADSSYSIVKLLIIYGLRITAELAYHFSQIDFPRYPSGRPITDMPFIYPRLCDVGKNYLPVIRYEGIYYSSLPDSQPGIRDFEEVKEKYCGTFYFFEPSSPYYLQLGKVLIASGKYHAYRILTGMVDEGTFVDKFTVSILKLFLRTFFGTVQQPELSLDGNREGKKNNRLKSLLESPDLSNRVKKQVTENIDLYRKMLKIVDEIYEQELDRHYAAKDILRTGGIYRSIGEFLSIIANDPLDSNIEFANVNLLLTRKDLKKDLKKNEESDSIKREYLGKALYGQLDDFDQQICEMARAKGYDTILLQREIGKSRIVTEILDVRPREVSYDTVCKIPSRPYEKIRKDIEKNKELIWFPNNGMITLQ